VYLHGSAEASTNPVARTVLDQSLDAIDALFRKRSKGKEAELQASPSVFPYSPRS